MVELGLAVPGTGGKGGDARATGADGLSAAEMGGDAQKGGYAEASAGNGGRTNFPCCAPFQRFHAGPGGDAFATGGRGGDGDPARDYSIDGADGGYMTTKGGLAWPQAGNPSGTHTIMGGRGGNGVPGCFESIIEVIIRVGSDLANSDFNMINAGPGVSFSLSALLGLADRGGNGGDGGAVTISPGLFNGVSSGSPVTLVIKNAANGGDGKNGIPPGHGGDPGSLTVSENPLIDPEPEGSFNPGEDGKPCGQATAPMLTVTLAESVQSQEAQPITFSSEDTRWVTVMGTLNDDNTFSAEGRGIVAGFSDIMVTFEGTYDPETGALEGEYAMDTEKLIHPLHPTVYLVETSGS